MQNPGRFKLLGEVGGLVDTEGDLSGSGCGVEPGP